MIESEMKDMNLSKLKGIIRERGTNYQQCANSIGKSIATFNSKINGKRTFTIAELEDLGNYLDMTDNEKVNIFLK